MYSFDDFHFTALLWDFYVLFHEYYSIETNFEWRAYCAELAQKSSESARQFAS